MLQYIKLLFLFIIILMIQACGGDTDTSGALSISTPTVTDNKDGTCLVSVIVTFTPPNNTTAAGVIVNTTAIPSFGKLGAGNGEYTTSTLTSLGNSVTLNYTLQEEVGIANELTITSSIGGMTASTVAPAPLIASVGGTTVQFLSTDPIGTSYSSTITGGTGTYKIVSVSTGDITASLSGTVLTVINNTTGIIPAQASVTVSDLSGDSGSVLVNYFK